MFTVSSDFRGTVLCLIAVAVWLSASSVCADVTCDAYGDVDGVGPALTISDFVRLVGFVHCDVGDIPNLYEADVNGDCVIDHGDVEMMMRFFREGLSCFPVYPVPTCCHPSIITGACVDREGYCHQRSEGNCLDAGGNYLGQDVLCDTDGDALFDCWEIYGYDHNSDGIIDVELAKMGANYLRRDIFVEVDWMAAAPGESQSHLPKHEAIERVIASFAGAPTSNQDGSAGIDLHVDCGQGGIFDGGNQVPYDVKLDPLDSEFEAIREANFDVTRRRIFHYCLFAHTIAGEYSGWSFTTPGSDFVVSLGGFPDYNGTLEQQAGTFMHELGHNLGLQHGGSDDINYKPNYLSVMNYHFQMSGLYNSGWEHYDYSRIRLNRLDPGCLDESIGLDAPPEFDNYGTRWCCLVLPDPIIEVTNRINDPIDWNCDGVPNGHCVPAILICDLWPRGSEYVGHNDWANLVFDGGSIGPAAKQGDGEDAGARRVAPSAELTWEEYSKICVRRGDADNSLAIDIDDVVYLINFIFSEGSPPAANADGDIDASGQIDIDDVVYLISYIFSEGPLPKCY